MTKTLTTLILAFTVLTGVHSQDYMTKIAEEACQCVTELDADKDHETLTMEFGLCVLEASMPYKKQLKKDHDIDMSKIDEVGEELGLLVGMEMASVCPDELIKLSGYTDEELPEDEFLYLFEGTVTKITSDQFVVFSVRSPEGKTLKFYWLTFVNSNVELSEDYQFLQDREVELYYEEYEFYDPRLKEYRDFNVIHEIEMKE